jgi:peptide/nickel transport system substrate-binding protein
LYRSFWLVLSAALLCGCKGGTSPGPGAGDEGSAGAARRGGTLNLALAADVKSVDPATAFDTYSTGFTRATTARLLDYGAGMKLEPMLAERWEVSADRKLYTFHLRPGLKFADGSPLEAADFKAGLERTLRPTSASPGAEFYSAIQGAVAYGKGGSAAVAGIEAPDAQTLRFRLERPSPTFLNVLSMTFAAPVPRKLAAQPGTGAGGLFEAQGSAVDSGPFVLKRYVRGQRLELARNPNYYRTDRPYLDGVELQIGIEERVQVLRFENGQIDVLYYIPSADYPRFKADPKWSRLMTERPVNTVWFLGMNTRLQPFVNVKVRQAVAHAVDPAKVIRLLNGRGRPLAGILPPTMPGDNPEVKGYPHDPARARTLLAEAGLSHGFSTTLWVGAEDRYLKVAQGVQADLKEVGIDAQLKPTSFTTYVTMIHKPDTTPIFYGGWYPDFPDPGNFLEPLFHSRQINAKSSTNSSFLNDPEVDRLLDQGASMPAGAERLKIYQQVEAAVMKDAPWAPLYQEVESRVWQPNVGGVTIDPVWPYLRLEEIWKAGP